MVEQNKTDSIESKPGVLTPLCLTSISKIDKIKERDYFENLAKQLQRLPVKRRHCPDYSKRLCKRLTHAKRDYYRTSQQLRKNEKLMASTMTDDMILPVKKLNMLSNSIHNDLVGEVTTVQILTNRRLKGLSENLRRLQEEKMNKKEFGEWKQKLLSIVREIKHLTETIRDPTDYDHFINELNKLWDKAKHFQQPQTLRAQIAEEIVRKLIGLPSIKEEKEKRKALDSLITDSLNYCLQDALDDYLSTQVEGWHRLEKLVWDDSNPYAENYACDVDVKLLKAIRENRHRQKKGSQIQIDQEHVDKILDEVNSILMPAYIRGERFCKEHLEKLNVQFDHINDILQSHSEILKVLANPDDKNLQSNLDSSTFPSTISYSDESLCLSTALATWVKQYTKEYVSGLQEQIDNLQRQVNNVPNRS